MIAAITTALALLSAPAAEEPVRYALTLKVVNAGIEAVSARTVIVEDGNASVTVNDSTGAFEMNASLAPVQGDGDDQLSLQVSIFDEGGESLEPNMILRRGGEARLSIGQQGSDGQMVDGLELTLSPITAAE
jgi:hypothetical protein